MNRFWCNEKIEKIFLHWNLWDTRLQKWESDDYRDGYRNSLKWTVLNLLCNFCECQRLYEMQICPMESYNIFNISMTLKILMNLFWIFYANFILYDGLQAWRMKNSLSKEITGIFQSKIHDHGNETYLNVCYIM